MQGRDVRLGLAANWPQFSLLVLINAFVGAMVGLERTILPLLAEETFGVAARTLILSFLIAFGIVKALANLFAGHLSDRIGRKRVLVVGWLFALPVPFLIIWAPTWEWVVFANVLLGINQGLAWSTTIVMKIDLAGPDRRGLAMGLNEAAGYIAVAASAALTGYLASTYALRPVPFYPGIAFAVLGLLFSVFFVRDTRAHTRLEAQAHARPDERHGIRAVFWRTTWKDKDLFAVSQAGLVNNLNDGLAWGLLPLFLAGAGLGIDHIGLVAATYPFVWGFGQMGTGAWSDRVGRKPLIVGGMLLQGVALAGFLFFGELAGWLAAAAALGIGTALVYPTLLAAVSDVAHPTWRASAVGVYRLWRDLGYAVGALVSGVLADLYDLGVAIGAVAALTLLSGLLVALVLRETRPRTRPQRLHT